MEKENTDFSKNTKVRIDLNVFLTILKRYPDLIFEAEVKHYGNRIRHRCIYAQVHTYPKTTSGNSRGRLEIAYKNTENEWVSIPFGKVFRTIGTKEVNKLMEIKI